MMPVYGHMDSNPQQRNQTPFPQHYFPGFEAVPPHFKVDQSKPSMMYESWPCSSNWGSYPVPYPSCCNHGNFPGYYSFRPPCPHFAPPSPAFHPYPNYPLFAEAYPVYYAPPRHYSNEQPRYEYDKDAHTNYHCCGCPNHISNKKNDRSLKIEEQEPEKKEGDSVVPAQPISCPYQIVWIPPENLKNNEYRNDDDQLDVIDGDKASRFVKPREQEPNSYPIVWIPHEYMRSKDHGKRNDQSEVSNSDTAPGFVKPSKGLKPTEQQPGVWNGWFPLDMNGLKSLMQGEGQKKPQNQQNEDKMSQFPFPVFWVPSDANQEGENQDKPMMIAASDHTKQAPGSFKLIPVEPSVKDVKINKPQSDKETQSKIASEIRGKTAANQECFPNEHKGDKSEGTEKRGRDVSMKHIEDTAKDELRTIPKRKSPSPPKTSELSPVCLRVDPLPKKGNGNSSPRLPSPFKEQPQDTLTKASTRPSLKEDFAVNTQNINGSLDKVEPGERKRKDIQVIEERSQENKAVESGNASQDQVSGNLPVSSQEVSGKPTMESESKTEGETKANFEANSVKATNPDESSHGQCKAETKRMADEAAAKLIQSAFRGFEVRKWEPLKKLKQIAKVREQVDEIRNRIQSLEFSSDRDKDDRQRLLIGEKIMTLLLGLDTIQGLHSSVRDARKSLVREIVTLQEKLDSLTSKWAQEQAKNLGLAESADCSSDQARRNVSTEKANKNASGALEDTNENRNHIKKPDQEYLTTVDGKDEETTEPPIVGKDLDGKIENMEPRIEDGDVSPSLEHMTQMPSVPEQKFDADKFVEANDLTRGGKPEVVEVTNLFLVDKSAEDDKLRSLREANHVDAVCEPEKETGNSNGEEESDLPINPSLPDEVENLRCTKEDQEIALLKELPVGIIEEEPDMSETEKQGLHETEEISQLFEDRLAGSKLEEQLKDAASNNRVKDQEENEFTNNPELEVEVEQKEVNNDNKFEAFFKPEGVPLTVGEENNDKVQQQEDDSETIPADHMTSSESEAGGDAIQEKEVLFEEKKEADQPVGTEEKEEIKLENEIEVQKQKCMNNEPRETAGESEKEVLFEEKKEADQQVGTEEKEEIKLENEIEVQKQKYMNNEPSETAGESEKEVLFEEKKEADQPVGTEEKEEIEMENEIEIQEQKCMNNEPRETAGESVILEEDAPTESNFEQEFLPASPAARQMLEPDLAKIEGGNNLIEENKKLKEIMEKLMEAGKDQLNVISNLTERVKDLEEKLSKNKKSSKPRYRKVRYAPSYSKPVRARGKATEVAV